MEIPGTLPRLTLIPGSGKEVREKLDHRNGLKHSKLSIWDEEQHHHITHLTSQRDLEQE